SQISPQNTASTTASDIKAWGPGGGVPPCDGSAAAAPYSPGGACARAAECQAPVIVAPTRNRTSTVSKERHDGGVIGRMRQFSSCRLWACAGTKLLPCH